MGSTTSTTGRRPVRATAASLAALLVTGALGLGLLPGAADAAVRRGTPGNDQLVGTARDDAIRALRGNDRVNGISGADRLLGGPGRDQLFQSRPDAPVARMSGGPGDDTVVASGFDQIFGGRGDDDLLFTAGQEGAIVDCGPGRDVARVDTFTRQRSEIRRCERIRRSGTRAAEPAERLEPMRFLVVGPAAMQPETRAPARCVSRPEYRAAQHGMTRGRVQQVFGTTGRRESISGQDGESFEVRSYRACTPSGRVAVSYAGYRLHAKSAVF